MDLAPSQPNIEFWNTECYGGPKQFTDYPDGDNSHAFSLIAELFAPKSRGTVTLKSADPKDNPVVNHNYLSNELDVLVLSEACRFGNEIITMGKGTKDIVEGAWPKTLTHHKYATREDWVPFVKDNATTCEFSLPILVSRADNSQAITPEEPAKWVQMTTLWRCSIQSFESEV